MQRRLGKTEQAVATLERYLREGPDDARVAADLGGLQLELKRPAAALAAYHLAARTDPEHAPYRLALARCLRQLAMEDRAIEELEACLQLQPDNVHCQRELRELTFGR